MAIPGRGRYPGGRWSARVLLLLAASAALLLIGAAQAAAGPAQPGEFVVEQPNGGAFIAEKFGDEWGAGYQSSSGYTLIVNEDTGY